MVLNAELTSLSDLASLWHVIQQNGNLVSLLAWNLQGRNHVWAFWVKPIAKLSTPDDLIDLVAFQDSECWCNEIIKAQQYNRCVNLIKCDISSTHTWLKSYESFEKPMAKQNLGNATAWKKSLVLVRNESAVKQSIRERNKAVADSAFKEPEVVQIFRGPIFMQN